MVIGFEATWAGLLPHHQALLSTSHTPYFFPLKVLWYWLSSSLQLLEPNVDTRQTLRLDLTTTLYRRGGKQTTRHGQISNRRWLRQAAVVLGKE